MPRPTRAAVSKPSPTPPPTRKTPARSRAAVTKPARPASRPPVNPVAEAPVVAAETELELAPMPIVPTPIAPPPIAIPPAVASPPVVSRAARPEYLQYLTFELGQQEYGIEILRVQEIRGYTAVTTLPNMPSHIKGVMDLRGAVIPVVDLRARFGMEACEYTRFTVIIVVAVGTRVVGMVVDGVSDVIDVIATDVVPTPEMGSNVDTSFLSGMAKSGEQLVSLLKIERVLDIMTADEPLAA